MRPCADLEEGPLRAFDLRNVASRWEAQRSGVDNRGNEIDIPVLSSDCKRGGSRERLSPLGKFVSGLVIGGVLDVNDAALGPPI